MVDVKTFYDFTSARATLCGDPRGRCSKTEKLFTISAVRGRLSAEIRVVDVKQTEDILGVLICARDVVDVIKLRAFLDCCGLRAPSPEICMVDVKN